MNIPFSLNVFHQNIGEYPLLSEFVSPKVLSQVELAGEPVLRIGGEEWDKLAASLVFPCKVFDFLISKYLTWSSHARFFNLFIWKYLIWSSLAGFFLNILSDLPLQGGRDARQGERAAGAELDE